MSMDLPTGATENPVRCTICGASLLVHINLNIQHEFRFPEPPDRVCDYCGEQLRASVLEEHRYCAKIARMIQQKDVSRYEG